MSKRVRTSQIDFEKQMPKYGYGNPNAKGIAANNIGDLYIDMSDNSIYFSAVNRGCNWVYSSSDPSILTQPVGFTPDSVDTISTSLTYNLFAISGERTFWTNYSSFYKESEETIAVSMLLNEVQYIYYDDDGELATSVNLGATGFDMTKHALVAAVQWNDVTDSAVYYTGNNELHTTKITGFEHYYKHEYEGTRYKSGLSLDDFDTTGGGGSEQEWSYRVNFGSIQDEDILHELPTITRAGFVPVLYRLAGRWTLNENDTLLHENNGDRLYCDSVTGRPYYNDSANTLVVTDNNKFISMFVIATNDERYPYMALMGQFQYDSINDLRDNVQDELNNLILIGLPFAEFRFIGQVVYQVKDAYTNSKNAVVVEVDTGVKYIDLRNENIAALSSSGGINVHANLDGLTSSDDHTQYALLDGRVGDVLKIDSIAPNVNAGPIGISNSGSESILDLLDNRRSIAYGLTVGNSMPTTSSFGSFDIHSDDSKERMEFFIGDVVNGNRINHYNRAASTFCNIEYRALSYLFKVHQHTNTKRFFIDDNGTITYKRHLIADPSLETAMTPVLDFKTEYTSGNDDAAYIRSYDRDDLLLYKLVTKTDQSGYWGNSIMPEILSWDASGDVEFGGNATFNGNVGIGTTPTERLHVAGKSIFDLSTSPSSLNPQPGQITFSSIGNNRTDPTIRGRAGTEGSSDSNLVGLNLMGINSDNQAGFEYTGMLFEVRRLSYAPITTGSAFRFRNDENILLDIDAAGIHSFPESARAKVWIEDHTSFVSTLYDTASMVSGNTFITPVAGTYTIDYSSTFSTAGHLTYLAVQLKVNGVVYMGYENFTSDAYATLSFSETLELDAGDVISVPRLGGSQVSVPVGGSGYDGTVSMTKIH